jgi:hypothetical protein
MIEAARAYGQQNRARPIGAVCWRERRQADHDSKRDGAEADGEMRPLTHLIEEAGGERGREERTPKDRGQVFQPNADKGTERDATGDGDSHADPFAERAFGVGEAEQHAGQGADQRAALLVAQQADQERQSDIDEEKKSAAEIEIGGELGEAFRLSKRAADSPIVFIGFE